MPRTIHLVRHGEVENPDGVVYASLPGFGLSALGRRQAESTAARLGSANVSLIVSSPLARAVETAAAIARSTGAAVSTDDLLTEWRLAERWSGVRWADLDTHFPGEVGQYLETPTDLAFCPEPIAELVNRMRTAIDAYSGADGAVVFVSHQDPVQAARLSLTGRPLSQLHVEKPGHATLITLEAHQTRNWVERERWDPPQGGRFPPSDAASADTQ